MVGSRTYGAAIGALLMVFGIPGLAADSDDVSRAEYDKWRAEVSNWGRWGKDDELGTLNFITADKKVAAASLVREGLSVSMALELNKVADDVNVAPFE
ncbi:MAG: hypothetical protein ACC642_05875, partial [Pseudomonadales bacterium]